MFRRLITTAAVLGGLLAAPAGAATVTTYDMTIEAKGSFLLKDTWRMSDAWTETHASASWIVDGTTQGIEFVDGEHRGVRGASVTKLYATAHQRIDDKPYGRPDVSTQECEGKTVATLDGPELGRGRTPEGTHLLDVAPSLTVQIGPQCENWTMSEIDFTHDNNLRVFVKLPVGQDRFTVPLRPAAPTCPHDRPDIDSCTNTWSGTATFVKTGEREVDADGRTVEPAPKPAPAPAPPAPPAPAPPAPPAPQPPASGGPVATPTPVATFTAGMRGPRAVFVTVRCAGMCRGAVSLFPGSRTSGRPLADGTYSRIAAGTSTVKLHLTAREARALRRAGGGRVVVRTERLDGAPATRRVVTVRGGR